jgi:AcrR family transcriptional regulator
VVVKKRNEHRTREQIVAAALKLVSQNGYAGTSIAKICAEAGLNASSVYWFFDNKEDLFLCTIKEAAEEFLEAVKIPAQADPIAWEDDSSNLIKAVAQRLGNNASFLRLLLIMMLEEQNLPAELRSKIAQIRAGSLAWWENFLSQVFAPMGTTTATIFASDFAPFCRATINGAFIAQQYGEPVDLEQVMRQLVLLMSALIEKIARER